MTRDRRRLLGAAVALLLVLGTGVVVVHAPPVQQWGFERAARAVSEATGWRLAADRVTFRLWPARISLQGVRLDAGGEPVVTLASATASWKWRRIVATPPRIERLDLEKVTADLTQLPEPTAAGAPAGQQPIQDTLQKLEVGRVELRSGTATALAGGLDLALDGVRLVGELTDGRAHSELHADNLTAVRQGRSLTIGPIEARLDADSSGATLEQLTVAGDGLQLAASGRLTDAGVGRLEFALEAELADAAAWWDPNLASGLRPSGRAVLVGWLSREASGAIDYSVEHRGQALQLVGYSIDEVEVERRSGVPWIRTSGRGWGALQVSVVGDGAVAVEARLANAPIGSVVSIAVPGVADRLRGPLTLSGRIDGRFNFPVVPAELTADLDVVVESSAVRAELRASGAGMAWRFDRVYLTLAGARFEGQGRLDADGTVSGGVDFEVPEPRRLADALALLGLALDRLEVAGGPVVGSASVSGSLAQPQGTAGVTWTRPAVMGVGLDRLALDIAGGPNGVDWRLEAMVVPDVEIDAEGRTEPGDLATVGDWQVRVGGLEALQAGGITGIPDGLTGTVHGSGSFRWAMAAWQAVGEVTGTGVGAGDWGVDSVRVTFEADAEGLEVTGLEVQVLGGVASGHGRVGMAGPESPLEVELSWRDIDLTRLPLELERQLEGTVHGSVNMDGELARPTGTLRLGWLGGREATLIDELVLVAALDDGQLRLVTERFETAVGAVTVSASVPLGDLTRPPWLWPEAPGGPARIGLQATGFRSDPVAAALGIDGLPVQLSADVTGEALWDFLDPGARYAELTLAGVELENDIEPLRATGTVTASLHGDVVEIAPFELVGDRSLIEAEGRWLVSRAELEARAEATLTAEVARLAPVPLRGRGPIRLELELEGPVSGLTGRLEVDHRGGELVLRDPALELRDLQLTALIEDGVVYIEEGTAQLNRGTVLVGGGWDTEVGQGIVFELEDVIVLLPMSILTSWSGNVAIEPDPDRTARVVADLVLQGGVWDRPINLTEAVLGAASLAPAADDPLQEIALDLQLRGRGGIHVENNLGEFDINWGVLQVLGTAAQPVLRGDIRVAPGGRLILPGQTVTVRRGLVQFTGNPATDPILEIVPEEDILTVSGENGASLNATMLATRSLARGIGSALGLENETLRPAEIGVETETDSSSRFTVGQRLSRNVALFFTSDLGNVQDQTTMLQLWNLPGLSGLAVQGYSRTADEELGVNLIQRFRWGGTSGGGDRPTIQKIRLEGSWPVGKRRLKKATGLRKGEPYQPFLLFAARLRMERELAESGYQDARVEGRAEGGDQLPTLVFSVDPGDRQIIRFVGADPPGRVRREVVSLYQPPPLESASLDLMAATLRRHYAAEKYPDATIEVRRQGELIEAIIDRGPKRTLEGPVVTGVDEGIAGPIRQLIGAPAELDHLLDNPDQGRRVVERLLYIRGYHEASVTGIWLEEVDHDIGRVHLDIELGQRATVGNIEVKGQDPLGLMTRDPVALRPGMPLDRTEIDVAASRIRSEYIAAGYSDVEFRVRPERDSDGAWNLVVSITPGAKRTVAEIDVNGLRHIRENVIRRGLRVISGDELLPAELDGGVARVASFAPVRRVTATTRPLPGNQSRVEMAVEEKPRWTVEAGGGWSSERGAEGRLGLRDDNLFGRGFGLNLRARWQRQEQLVFLYASLPPLPGGKISMFANVGFFDGDSKDNPDFISEQRTTAAIESTYAISSGTSARLYYRISESVFDLKVSDPTLDPIFPSTEMEAILGTQLVRDRLDSPFDPRSGYYAALDVSWNSSALGSDLDDLRAVLTGSLALAPRERWTWAQTVRIGWAEGLLGQNLSANRRFYAGGQASIRGFDTDSVGPVNDVTGDPRGGGALFILNDEIRIPVWNGLRLAVFADVGQVWDTWSAADLELAVGAGLGFRWSTPIGPVWGDVAWPVANRGISSGGAKFYLGIGRPF